MIKEEAKAETVETAVGAIDVLIDEEIFEDVRAAVQAAEEKKAQELVVLQVAEITSFTDYFIICSGSSTRQVQAIADAITEQLKRRGVRPMNTEGYANAEWVLIDFGTFVAHIFTETSRRFYDLERLWRDAKKVSVES
jgi:ribosome-associated protein